MRTHRCLLWAALWIGASGCAPSVGTPTYCPPDRTRDLTGTTPITLSGDPGGAVVGHADPSISYLSGASIGFLSYSVAAPRQAFTRVAASSDLGATWTFAGQVNAVSALTITTNDNAICGASSCSGNWVHEMSTLVEDPTDPDPARRFKVFTHSYFISDADNQRFEIGSINLYTTADPLSAEPWAETRLLGWNSSSPHSSTGVAINVSTDPVLSPLLGDCLFLFEPGAMVRGGTLELALTCTRFVSSTSIPFEVVLIRSTDHGATWTPVRKVLDLDDARALGGSGPWGPQLNAVDLFEADGAHYLFVTPNGPVSNFGAANSGYRGCLALRFANIETGEVERCEGAPRVVDAIIGPEGLFHGACTYREAASAAGVLVISADTRRTPPYQIFRAGSPGP